jgi:ribosome biogenesis protein SSF1/2
MKKLVTNKSFPNLGKYNDLGDYLMQSGGSASESEPELDDGTNNVELPHKMTGQGNLKNEQSAVRLTEIGPRLSLDLYKIEEDLCKGKILYHKLVEKSEEELKEIEARRDEKQREKEIRKQEQENNMRKKKGEKKKKK